MSADDASPRDRTIRIAVACDDDRGLSSPVSAHFGRCPFYTLAEVRGDEILWHEVVVNPHFDDHVPGAVPAFLAGLKPDVVLAGGMGPRAIALFSSYGIEVATGHTETVAEAFRAWVAGDRRGVAPCAHDHPDSCGGREHEPMV